MIIIVAMRRVPNPNSQKGFHKSPYFHKFGVSKIQIIPGINSVDSKYRLGNRNIDLAIHTPSLVEG